VNPQITPIALIRARLSGTQEVCVLCNLWILFETGSQRDANRRPLGRRAVSVTPEFSIYVIRVICGLPEGSIAA
jgi:hypothetical protein